MPGKRVKRKTKVKSKAKGKAKIVSKAKGLKANGTLKKNHKYGKKGGKYSGKILKVN